LARDDTSFIETPPQNWSAFTARFRYETEGAKITSPESSVFEPPSITSVFSVGDAITERLRHLQFFRTIVFRDWEVTDSI